LLLLLYTVTHSGQWYSWGPSHMQCCLCSNCWSYWKKYGGLKMPTRLGIYFLFSFLFTADVHIYFNYPLNVDQDCCSFYFNFWASHVQDFLFMFISEHHFFKSQCIARSWLIVENVWVVFHPRILFCWMKATNGVAEWKQPMGLLNEGN